MRKKKLIFFTLLLIAFILVSCKKDTIENVKEISIHSSDTSYSRATSSVDSNNILITMTEKDNELVFSVENTSDKQLVYIPTDTKIEILQKNDKVWEEVSTSLTKGLLTIEGKLESGESEEYHLSKDNYSPNEKYRVVFHFTYSNQNLYPVFPFSF